MEALRYLVIEKVIGRDLVIDIAELLAKDYSEKEVSQKLNIKRGYVRWIKNSLQVRGAKGVYLNHLTKYIPTIRALPRLVTAISQYRYRCLLCGKIYYDIGAMYRHMEQDHYEVIDKLVLEVVRSVAKEVS